jgi:nucleoside-diphosphate-sugar epimerase
VIENRTILLTGGAGFIGVTLALRLFRANRVRILDNFHRDALSRESELATSPNVEIVRGDVLDPECVRRAVRGVDAVVHLAAIAGVDTVMRHPVKTMQVGLLGTANVLEAAREAGTVKRLVDFSTSEVFGRYAFKVGEGDSTQMGAVGEARWTYAVSKLATEHLCHNYWKEFGLPTVAVRPFNIFGPRQVGEGAIHHFIVRALKGEPLTVHNDGAQIRSWCYVDDIARGIELVLEREEAVGHTFNIGNPRSTVTIHHLARDVVRLAGSRSPITQVPWDFPDVELRIPNIDKARQLLGYEPQVDLEEGLVRTIAWYRQVLGA